MSVQKQPKRDRNVPPGVLNPARRTITNKIMKDSITWDKYSYESDGKEAVATLTCGPGGGPPMHYHNTYNEYFEAVEGNLVVYLNTDDDRGKHVLKPGEKAAVPIGTAHRFSAEGDKDITFRGRVEPGHAGFERSLYIIYGLANDGLSDATGLPKSLVHIALVGSMSDMKFTGFAGMIMNVMSSVLAWYGRWSGEEERLLAKYWD